MKSKLNSCFLLVFISAISFFVGNSMYAQERFNLTAGFGVPELINIGLKYQLDEQSQLGLTAGTEFNMIALSGDLYFHFAGSSKFSYRRPWYGRAGLTYWRNDDEFATETWLWLSPRIGRDLNISERWGIAIDAGVAFRLQNEEVIKKPQSNPFNIDIDFPILPALGIAIFYRL